MATQPRFRNLITSFFVHKNDKNIQTFKISTNDALYICNKNVPSIWVVKLAKINRTRKFLGLQYSFLRLQLQMLIQSALFIMLKVVFYVKWCVSYKSIFIFEFSCHFQLIFSLNIYSFSNMNICDHFAVFSRQNITITIFLKDGCFEADL